MSTLKRSCWSQVACREAQGDRKMADIWSSTKRSEVMARIRKRDSGPELALRKHFSLAKIPYQIYADLPGTPDMIVEGSRLAVFVHGCFWHGCPRHYRAPRTNVEYWSEKLRRNKTRDAAIARRIRAMGWHCSIVWECELTRNPRRAIARLLRRLEKIERASASVRGLP